ncbi:hypothetical protein [Streptomyces europaeiscabiei]|uniref:hypothetical protein n=1 Tax=Streptomyces europaeiscabiei TaxID=146819 RepID=UPI0029C06639|nr:hypothetical protein [Streptomyces europaeiscabiei]
MPIEHCQQELQARIAASEHYVRLDPPPLEATVDAATWLTGLIRFDMDEHVQHTCPHDDR